MNSHNFKIYMLKSKKCEYKRKKKQFHKHNILFTISLFHQFGRALGWPFRASPPTGHGTHAKRKTPYKFVVVSIRSGLWESLVFVSDPREKPSCRCGFHRIGYFEARCKYSEMPPNSPFLSSLMVRRFSDSLFRLFESPF